MKVAYLINQYPKGSHTFIRREIVALERHGAEVSRFAIRGWDAESGNDEDRTERERTRYLMSGGLLPVVLATLITCIRSPLQFCRALKCARRRGRQSGKRLLALVYLAEACLLRKWLRRSPVDYLHAHFGTNATDVAMLCRELGGPKFGFTVHGPEEFDRPQALGLHDKIARAEHVIAISSFGRSQLWRWCRVGDRAKVRVAHCGLEAAFFGNRPEPIADSPRLCCIGRLDEQKGHLLLIEAAAELATMGVEFELVLAGDGLIRADIERAIDRHGLGAKVRITGWIANREVQQLLLGSRALVLPSFAEGLPVVIMEAMALARPVLTTYIAGIPELVRDGREGFLFPAGSAAAAARAMRKCLELPIAELDRMGAAGRERVKQRHDIDREARRLIAIWSGASLEDGEDRS